MGPRTLAALLALVAAGAPAGCGGDDETTTTTTGVPPPTLSEEAFLTQANAICAAASEELNLVDSLRAQIDAIRALPAPAEIRDDVNSLLDDAAAVLAELEADPSVLEEEPFAELGERAEELGLTECAE
jgi:hypothetical protein